MKTLFHVTIYQTHFLTNVVNDIHTMSKLYA